MLKCMCISFFLIPMKFCQMVVGRKYCLFWKQCANRVYFKMVLMKQGGVLIDSEISDYLHPVSFICRRML